MLEKNEQCKQVAINPKVQAIFVHILINVVFKYMLQVKHSKIITNTNPCVFGHIKFIMDVVKL
jgi:hypothetical protein